MAKIQIPFLGQYYQYKSKQVDASTCLNWYMSSDPTGKFDKFLIPRPGLTKWYADTTKYQNRGALQLNRALYVVIDDSAYVYVTKSYRRKLGTLKTSTGRVNILANDSQIFFTDGRHGYVYQLIKNDDHDAEDFYEIESVTDFIGKVTFYGSGLDDMTNSGSYSGYTNKTYRVEIDTVATPDTFQWSDDGGDTWNETGVAITGSDQLLNDGVYVKFEHITSHTLHDYWEFKTSTDSSFYVPIIPAYQDTYGVYARKVSNYWSISSSENFAQNDALDNARASAWPDDLVAAVSIQEEVWLICENTMEVWYDTGDEGFPFQRRNNLVIPYGCAAAHTVKVGGNNILFFLGKNKESSNVIVRISGYQVEIISTEP